MIIRNSLRHILRTPIRSILGIILLATTTAVLLLGISMWISATQGLDLAGKAFSTIGVVEYRSDTGRRTSHYDLPPIADSEYVEHLDHRTLLAGYSEDIKISTAIIPGPWKPGMRYSILEFTPMEIPVDDGPVLCRVLTILYSYDDDIIAGYEMLINFDEGFSLEPGKKYITSGFLSGGKYYVYPYDLEEHLFGAGILQYGDLFAAVMEVTEDDYLEKGDGQLWGNLIMIFKNSLHTLPVYTTNDLESMLIFHQGKAIITSGRSFSNDDYEKGNRVCIISASVARNNNLEPGDTLSVAFHEQRRYYYYNSIAWVAYSPLTTGIDQGSYEVIGIYQVVIAEDSPYGIYDDTIFIPQNSISYEPNRLVDDNLVSFRLSSNDTVEEFLTEMEQYEQGDYSITVYTNTGHEQYDFSITIYDQGYAQVADALTNMKKTALLLMVICAAAGLGLVILFSLLFVSKQKRNIAIMYSLGTSRRKLLGFLLATVLIVSGLAVSIGTAAGMLLSDQVLADVYARNREDHAQKSAYSGYYGSGTELEFQINAPNGPIAPLAAAGSVLALTLLLSSLYAAKVLSAEPMQVLTAKED